MHTLSNGVFFISCGNKCNFGQAGVIDDVPRFSESSWVGPQCLLSRVKPRTEWSVIGWQRHQAPPASRDIAALWPEQDNFSFMTLESDPTSVCFLHLLFWAISVLLTFSLDLKTFEILCLFNPPKQWPPDIILKNDKTALHGLQSIFVSFMEKNNPVQ